MRPYLFEKDWQDFAQDELCFLRSEPATLLLAIMTPVNVYIHDVMMDLTFTP